MRDDAHGDDEFGARLSGNNTGLCVDRDRKLPRAAATKKLSHFSLK